MVMSQALKEEMVYLEFLVGIWVELSCLVHCFIPLTFYFLFIQYVLFPAVHDKYPRNKLHYTMCSHSLCGILWRNSPEAYSVASGANESLALTLELSNGQILLDFLNYKSCCLHEVELPYLW